MTDESCGEVECFFFFFRKRFFFFFQTFLLFFLLLLFLLLLLSYLQVADGRGVDDVADDEALNGLVLGDQDARRLAADALDLWVERG